MPADTPISDQRIAQQLNELDLDYSIDDDGDFHAIYQLSDERTQGVVISSTTHNVAGLELRKIYSVSYQSSEPLPQNIANLLLGINHRSHLGSWQLMESQGIYYAAYSAQVPAETKAASLLALIKVVAESADSIEDYLTGADVF